MPTRRFSGTATAASDPDNGGDHSGGGGGTYVDDVFSTYLYEGTNTSTQHQIQNGIDLAGEGGLVWIKKRDSIVADSDHQLYDTERGNKFLASNKTNSEGDGDVASFNNDGWTFNASTGLGSDYDGAKFASWTFRKAKNFFDVVTYTGDGTNDQAIPHNLGVEPGMILIKNLGAGNWVVYHRGVGLGNYGWLNSTNQFLPASGRFDKQHTGSEFYVGYDGEVNALNENFVAYVFAHDDSDESMIKCGSYTGNGTDDGVEIDLGFEPQWILIKKATGAGTDGWLIADTMRGIPTGGGLPRLFADSPDAELLHESLQAIDVTPTGFRVFENVSFCNAAGLEYIYMAIRRPNKPAEEFDPDELFAIDPASSYDRLPTFTSGFPVDLSIHRQPVGGTSNWFVGSRLIQERRLFTNAADPESSDSTLVYDYPDGYSSGSLTNYHSYMWRRAQGFFDVVAYEGDGQAGREVPHNLGVKPEMIWVKQRNYTDVWYVYAEALGNDKTLYLNEDSAASSNDTWNNTDPDELTFTVAGTNGVNHNSYPMIAYLFASVPGISKVGSYTGTGASIDIDCGFATGARFVLIKRADGASGNWYVFDVELGITSPDAPFLKLDQTNAVSSGYNNLSPFSGGFTVNHAGANLSASGSKYIFYAIA